MKRLKNKIIAILLIISVVFPMMYFAKTTEAKAYKFTVYVGKTKTILLNDSAKSKKVKWSISNKNVVKVIKKVTKGARKKYIIIQGKRTGKTTITATYTVNNKKKTVKCIFTIKNEKGSVADTIQNSNTTTTQNSSNGTSNLPDTTNNNVSNAVVMTPVPDGSATQSGATQVNDTARPSPTPWKYASSDIIYKQHYDVNRWYDSDRTGAINGHKHDGYKNNTFAIWMVGFFDNLYSTDEDDLNTFEGPILDDYKGKPLNITGEFYYEGTNQKTILFQINYTSPSDYPILYKWEDGSKGLDSKYSNELRMQDNTGGISGKLNANTITKMDLVFTIPTNAKNGDKDPETGRPYGIYVYFPNKPGGALAYVKDNTFHFKNFIIKQQ